MDHLYEQAITCIRQSGLEQAAADLVALLRYAIRMDGERVPLQRLEPGASRVGGLPDLPAGIEWPTNTDDRSLAFYAQICCADLAPFDPHAVLPHTGWLSFFYDVENVTDADPDAGRVLYVPGEQANLIRTPAPETLDEWHQFGCCAVTFSPLIMLPCADSSRLEDVLHDMSVMSDEWAMYEALRDQLRMLSGPQHSGVHLLGYPDESWILEQDPTWTHLFQIDCNAAAWQGAERMQWADGLILHFWIPLEKLARSDFSQTQVFPNIS